jgi:hypothetical protein
MATTAASFWDWSLAVLPFTAITTFIVTLVTCNLVSNYVPAGEYLLPISQLGTGQAYVYFIVGISLIFAQLLALIVGRLQFLLQTQSIINRIVLYVIHIITIIPLGFMFIVAIVSRNNRSDAYLLGAYGVFGSISLYCFLHTAVVFYLYIRRSKVSQHSKVIYPIWFLVCTLLLIIFFIIWHQTNRVILGYIAAASPFLYFLGFVPQFWSQAKSRKRYSAVSRMVKNLR